MDKKLRNIIALELNNEALEEAMRTLMQDKTGENMAKSMEIMRDARLLVPAEFPKNMDKEAVGRLARGEKLDAKDAPKMLPVIVQNPNGERFAPAYTSKKHLPGDQKYQAILNVTFDEVLRIASEPKLNLSGIILNPATDKIILHPKLIKAVRKVKEEASQTKEGRMTKEEFIEAFKKEIGAVPQKKEIKMTREQFQVFARRNVEWGILPKNIFTGKAEFMNRLDAEREEYIAALYRQPYGDKIPCPYTAKDFDVMVLNISEDTCVASIELPEKNITPQTALALYIIWNPQNDDMHYFLIEKGQPDQDNVLSCITPDGKRQELQTAPSSGSELVTILDLLREEAEENASS